mgnify:FL=1
MKRLLTRMTSLSDVLTKRAYRLDVAPKVLLNELLYSYHYLHRKSGGYKSGANIGLWHDNNLVGACVFTGFPVPEIVQGAFGLDRNDQVGFWELSRLVLHPKHQSEQHNLASWFVSRAIKQLRAKESVRAILSYADADYHDGTIYAACNFRYFGLTAPKKDFWIVDDQLDIFSGKRMIKHQRGSIKGREGEWKDRSRKHRFLMVYDKRLKVFWKEEKWKKQDIKK